MISKQIEIILSGNLSSFNVQTAQKAELQKQKNLYYKKKQILYEQYIKGKMTEERFIKINLELTKELEPIQNKLEEIDFQLQCSQRRNLFQNQIEKIVENNFHSLTQELVDFFIDRINIFKDNRIEIRWKIQNFM